jgi:hypothetical protein
MAGILYEFDPNMTHDDVYSAKSSINVDGGGLVVLGDLQGDDFVATAPLTASKRVAIALNPSVHYTKVSNNVFAGLTQDDRDYTNLAGEAFDVTIPVVGRIYKIIDANVEGTTAPTKGKFLEVTNGKTTMSIKATQTADVPSFEVIRVDTAQFPKVGSIGDEFVPVYVIKCVNNG